MDEFKEKLTPEEFHVLREKGTEPAFSGEYYNAKDTGMYLCKACGQELFSSDTKFDSGTGWPSFYEPVSGRNVETEPDESLGVTRTEVKCSRCGSHLGHVFDDVPTALPDGRQATGKRFCINSLSLKLKKSDN
jgi:peptide-methionine (R)-S-oxide reductase